MKKQNGGGNHGGNGKFRDPLVLMRQFLRRRFRQPVSLHSQRLLLISSPCCERRLRISLNGYRSHRRYIKALCFCPRCGRLWVVAVKRRKNWSSEVQLAR